MWALSLSGEEHGWRRVMWYWAPVGFSCRKERTGSPGQHGPFQTLPDGHICITGAERHAAVRGSPPPSLLNAVPEAHRSRVPPSCYHPASHRAPTPSRFQLPTVPKIGHDMGLPYLLPRTLSPNCCSTFRFTITFLGNPPDHPGPPTALSWALAPLCNCLSLFDPLQTELPTAYSPLTAELAQCSPFAL